MYFTGGAYVIVKALEAGISISKGFYANYAQTGEPTIANYIYGWELAVMAMYFIYAAVVIGGGWYVADDLWKKMDTRLAEAN